jgi:dTDP-4-amino-4,6-dideoxygalactose transaminase
MRALEPKLSEAAVRVLQSGQVIGGPEVSRFEAEVAQYCGAGYGVACSSGSDALLLALTALGIGAGDEVICPPFTFFATVGAICRIGATPVFADIDPLSYNIDPLQIEAKITSKTKAIMVVHLFGQCAEMDAIWTIAERHDLPIIEDAAQAIGAEYCGKRAGSLGAMACYSFYPSKNLGAYGDAGMIVTSDPEWASLMVSLRNHGMEPKYHHKYMGWNGRCDAIQAALLRVKLPHLDAWTAARQAAAERYDGLLDEHHLGGYLQKPTQLPNRRHVFNQYVVRVAHGQRDALVRHFRAEKIGCEIYYPIPLHLQECLQHLGYGRGDFPASEQAATSVMAFPMFPEITVEQQRHVVQTVATFIRQQARRAA